MRRLPCRLVPGEGAERSVAALISVCARPHDLAEGLACQALLSRLGVKSLLCPTPPRLWIGPPALAQWTADAFAARKALHDHESASGKKVAHIGLGDASPVAVLSAYRQIANHFIDEPRPFALHIAGTNASRVRLVDYRTTGAPVLLLAERRPGAIDIKQLSLVVEDLERGGAHVTGPVRGGPASPLGRGPEAAQPRLLLDPASHLVDTRAGLAILKRVQDVWPMVGQRLERPPRYDDPDRGPFQSAAQRDAVIRAFEALEGNHAPQGSETA